MSVFFNRFMHFFPEEIIIQIWHDKELKLLFYIMGVWIEKVFGEKFLGKNEKNSNLVYKVHKPAGICKNKST